MLVDNNQNRKITDEYLKGINKSIQHQKDNHIYFNTVPTSIGSSAKFEKNQYRDKELMSGNASGTYRDSGFDRANGIGVTEKKKYVEGGFGLAELADMAPNAFKQTPGVIPALAMKALGMGKGKAKAKVKCQCNGSKPCNCKKKGGSFMDSLDSIAPFLGQASFTKNKTAGISGSDLLGLVGGEKQRSIGSGKKKEKKEKASFTKNKTAGISGSDLLGLVGGEKQRSIGSGKKKEKKEKALKGSGFSPADLLPLIGLGKAEQKKALKGSGFSPADLLPLIGLGKAEQKKGGDKIVPVANMKGTVVGAGEKKMSAWNQLVKDTKAKHGFKSLAETTQYIKKNNLYKKK